MTLSITPFEQLIAEAITGAIITGGQNGDAVKITARANAALSGIAGAEQILQGNAAQGVALLLSAAKTANLDPGVTLAIQGALALVVQQATLVNSVTVGTLAGQVAVAVVNNVIAGATAAANAEIARYAPASG
jgi:hypothetical protein